MYNLLPVWCKLIYEMFRSISFFYIFFFIMYLWILITILRLIILSENIFFNVQSYNWLNLFNSIYFNLNNKIKLILYQANICNVVKTLTRKIRLWTNISKVNTGWHEKVLSYTLSNFWRALDAWPGLTSDTWLSRTSLSINTSLCF